MCVRDKNKESGSTEHIYVTQKRTKSTEPYHICVQRFLRTISSTDVLKYHLIGLHLSSSLPSHPRFSLRWLVFASSFLVACAFPKTLWPDLRRHCGCATRTSVSRTARTPGDTGAGAGA